jgi:hypothetical protein
MAVNQAVVEAIYGFLTGLNPNSAGFGGTSRWTMSGLGLRINTVAAADVAGAWTPMFTIAGGLIAVTGFVGLRTFAQGGGASIIQFRHSAGPTVADNGLATITGDLANTLYSITGDPSDPVQIGNLATWSAKQVATSASYGAAVFGYCGPGTLDYFMTASTGSCRWILTYVPLDDAVTVV